MQNKIFSRRILCLFLMATVANNAVAQGNAIIDSLPFDIVINNNMAGSVNPKTANTFLGFRAAYVNTTGNHSTGIGSGALFSNTTGTHNTALGVSTLRYNTLGGRNTAIGMGVMRYNTIGFRNTGTGNDALRYNTAGMENTANGAFALDSNTTGSNNTAIGAYALRYSTSGNNNTALGHNAFSQLAGPFSNSTAIGANTVITASNQVRIGDANVTSIMGQVNFSAVSDERFKKNISSGGVPGLDFILKLQPVTYRHDMDRIAAFLHTPDNMRKKEVEARNGAMIHTGFIGQQVERLSAELGYDFSGIDKPKSANDYYGLRYAEFVVPLVKAVQEQQQIIKELQSEILQLKSDVKKMKPR